MPFSLDLAAKDLRLIAALADAVGVAMPGADTDLAVIEAAIAAGGGERDFSTVTSQLRAQAGSSARSTGGAS